MKSLGWFEASLYIPEESSDVMGQVSVAVEAKVFDRGEATPPTLMIISFYVCNNSQTD